MLNIFNRLDRQTKMGLVILAVIVVVVLILALYGYLSGAWDVDPTQVTHDN